MNKKTLLATLAVSALVLSQPAAAATRSFESVPAQGAKSAVAAERLGSITSESEEVAGRNIWLILVVFGIVAAIIAATTGSKSPG